MPLNNAGLVLLATTLQETLLFAQLHDGLAGVDGTDAVAVAGRQATHWGVPASSGEFGLVSAIDFAGGTPGGPVYSVTLWDTETEGLCFGEFPLTGDATFNSMGSYQVTVIDWTILLDEEGS